MACCHQAASHYLNQFWPSLMTPYGVTRPQCVNTCVNIIVASLNHEWYACERWDYLKEFTLKIWHLCPRLSSVFEVIKAWWMYMYDLYESMAFPEFVNFLLRPGDDIWDHRWWSLLGIWVSLADFLVFLLMNVQGSIPQGVYLFMIENFVHDWKLARILLVVTMILIIQSGHKFAHVTTAVQNCDLMESLFFK